MIRVGRDAVREKGWWEANKWLVMRRTSQLTILALFLMGPWLGLWIIKGNLNASLLLDTVPMTDFYIFLQSLVSGHAVSATATTGALIVLAFYLLVGGRSYCAWVCPVNIVTDAAEWARCKLDIPVRMRMHRHTRFWILGLTLLLAPVTGVIAWELVNPVSMLHRGLIYGMGLAWTIVVAVFLFDFVISRRGWCGRLCPVGACYSLLNHFTPIRVRAERRDACNGCRECLEVCPEPQVITPALKGESRGIGPVILSSQCTNCGRCIDICSKRVFEFGSRFDNKLETHHEAV